LSDKTLGNALDRFDRRKFDEEDSMITASSVNYRSILDVAIGIVVLFALS
jgi:hypothetical protein